jgi:hypothetical protein
LEKTQKLQSQFDRWAGNWLGGRKSKAIQDAQAEIASRKQEVTADMKEVFENEKFDTLRSSWKSTGLTMCSDPTRPAPSHYEVGGKDANGFTWMIDYSVSGIDAEGWTYSYDFHTLNRNGSGDNSKKWNSYVRRRKWRLEDKRTTNGTVES